MESPKSAHTRFPQNQRTNLTAGLLAALVKRAEEDELSFDKAFAKVALSILGYDYGDVENSDGKGDHGVDSWTVDEKAATIFQFKSHNFLVAFDPLLKANGTFISDIPRLYSLIGDINTIPDTANPKIVNLIKELRSAISRYGLTEESKSVPFDINIVLCCLASDFTQQTRDEFAKLSSLSEITWDSQRLNISASAIFIDDLLAEEWRESNTSWRTSSGQSDDKITLHVSGEMISTSKSLVFFTKANDLVDAFDRFGYQIFEPNVRCELKRSRVNEAIRESIKHTRGRKEFKHLNNGITLICANFKKVRRPGGDVLEVRQPGVINGLQTVKSIHDAYDELKDSQRDHFRSECEVLVRLHTRDAVADYRELVKSTNNQNPMQPRNLRSNDPEQIAFEKLFSDIGWFYERKEGAWKAFRSDSSLWGSLRGKSISDFKTSSGQYRDVDNLDLSQAWLSLIGFSNEAIHNKRDIFDGEKLYELIFKRRVIKHGYDYNLSFSDPAVRNDAGEQAPTAEVLLLSYLLREIADGLTPSRNKNREDAVARLKLVGMTKEIQDAALVQDAAYISGLVLAGAKYLFVDFVGLVLFRALGSSVYDVAGQLLRTKSMSSIFRNRDLEVIKAVTTQDDYDETDIFAVLWRLYIFCLQNIIEQASWRQQFEQAAVRSRFNYSDYNRRALFGQLEALDRVFQKRPYPQPWSEGMEKHKGIFAYVAAVAGNRPTNK